MAFVDVAVIVGMVSGVVLKRLGGSGGEAGSFISWMLASGFRRGVFEALVDVICGFVGILECIVVMICGGLGLDLASVDFLEASASLRLIRLLMFEDSSDRVRFKLDMLKFAALGICVGV